jgi:hypothetical protein
MFLAYPFIWEDFYITKFGIKKGKVNINQFKIRILHKQNNVLEILI